MARRVRLNTALAALLAIAMPAPAAAAAGQLVWGVHISLVPTCFEPAETAGLVTPFMLRYALHDSLVKPMPGNALSPSLAESWTVK